MRCTAGEDVVIISQSLNFKIKVYQKEKNYLKHWTFSDYFFLQFIFALYNTATFVITEVFIFYFHHKIRMKKYELMMIIDPMLEKQALETLISDLRSELDVHGLSLDSEVVWGVRDMAYKINGSKQGYYLIYTLKPAASLDIPGLNKAFGIKKGLWRYLLTVIPA
jgi:small subunit ribosomal protein S6